MYRIMTIKQARLLRKGKTRLGDPSIDSMVMGAAQRYNQRKWLIFSAFRLPQRGYYTNEVAARSDLER